MQDAHGLHKRMDGIRVVEEPVSKADFWPVGRRDKKTTGKTMKDADQIFAQQWIDAWNSRDLEQILRHYAREIEFFSPVAERRLGNGRVVGLGALRGYWGPALQAIPNLKFELELVLSGANCLTILYRNQNGARVAETMELDNNRRVVRSYACYSPPV